MAKKAIEAKEYQNAVDLLTHAQHYPYNLGEGKLYGAQENTIFYLLGCAFEGLTNPDRATECWQIASRGLKEPSSAIFYNDQQPDTIYYQGLALIRLQKKEEARERFETLINFGKLHLNYQFKLDYFAVSLPDLQIWDDDLTKRNHLNCLNLIKLGKSGIAYLHKIK